MIYGVGTDIVRVARFQAALDRFGLKFARRILTEQELSQFECAGAPARFLAKRFAAKEAAVKALGTGLRQGVSLRQIGVAHEPTGRPFLVYAGRASELIRELGIGASHLSIADEQDHAVAFVTLVLRAE